MGFGFSKEAPYFPPGTMIKFVEEQQDCTDGDVAVVAVEETRIITGMVAAYGNRSNEYATIVSLDRPISDPEALAPFLESYNITEIDGGDEGLCDSLSTIIRKYTYTIGDVDPICTSTDTMEKMVSSKFEVEMERMKDCVQWTILTSISSMQASQRRKCDNNDTTVEIQGIIDTIERIFSRYKEELRMQMRHQPLGTREWMQMFESYMTFAAAEEGVGFIDFVLVHQNFHQ
jgi:hypothetical protein